MILQADPGRSYKMLAPEIKAAVDRVLESGWYILGRENENFEKAFAAYNHSGYCLGEDSLIRGHLAAFCLFPEHFAGFFHIVNGISLRGHVPKIKILHGKLSSQTFEVCLGIDPHVKVFMGKTHGITSSLSDSSLWKDLPFQ